jgi:hypothetical protein
MAYHFTDNVYTKSFTPREYQVSYFQVSFSIMFKINM